MTTVFFFSVCFGGFFTLLSYKVYPYVRDNGSTKDIKTFLIAYKTQWFLKGEVAHREKWKFINLSSH